MRRRLALGIAAVVAGPLLVAYPQPASARPIKGTDSADVLVGTERRDLIRAHAGDDDVAALGGGDIIALGSGVDSATGGPGRDTILGHAGADDLRGGRHGDTIEGGPSDDTIVGGNGPDELNTGLGVDTVDAGPGDDLVYAPAADTMANTIACGEGVDTLIYPGPPPTTDLVTDCEHVERTDGPVESASGYGYSFSNEVGDKFTDGFEVLEVRGDEPVTVEAVTLLGNRGFEYLGAKFVGPGREIGSIQLLFHWPPVPKDFGGAKIVDALDATLSTHRQNSWGWELLVGMTPSREGRVRRDGVAVSYTTEGVRYRAEFRGEIIVCTSPKYETRHGRCSLS